MIQNILNIALGILPKQQATLHRWTGRTINEVGLDVDTYADGVPFTGSIQAIDRVRYGYMGLDASKSYISIITTCPIDDVSPDKNPDFIIWQGRKWEVVNKASWQQQSGYNAVLAIDVGAV